ncbi:unnamed protein product [Diplocarpon coronariae]
MEQLNRTMLSAAQGNTARPPAPARNYEPRAMDMLYSILLKIKSPVERENFDWNFRLQLDTMIFIMREPGAFFAGFTSEQKIWYIDSVMFEKCYPGIKYPEPYPPTRDEVHRVQIPEPQNVERAEGSPMPHQVPRLLEMARRTMPLNPIEAPWSVAATKPNLWAAMLSGAGGDGGDNSGRDKDFVSNEDAGWNGAQSHHQYPLTISDPRHAMWTRSGQSQTRSNATNIIHTRENIPVGAQPMYEEREGRYGFGYPRSSYPGSYQPTSHYASENSRQHIDAIQAALPRRGISQFEQACIQSTLPPMQLYIPERIQRLPQRELLSGRTSLAPTPELQQQRNGSFHKFPESNGNSASGSSLSREWGRN